jgi:hypothetical protein
VTGQGLSSARDTIHLPPEEGGRKMIGAVQVHKAKEE